MYEQLICTIYTEVFQVGDSEVIQIGKIEEDESFDKIEKDGSSELKEKNVREDSESVTVVAE